jgi:hypothetical protein
MLPCPSVAWTAGKLAPRSIACKPWACRSQCSDTASSIPAVFAVAFIIKLTTRSVSRSPSRLANVGSLAPASPRSDNRERLRSREAALGEPCRPCRYLRAARVPRLETTPRGQGDDPEKRQRCGHEYRLLPQVILCFRLRDVMLPKARRRALLPFGFALGCRNVGRLA